MGNKILKFTHHCISDAYVYLMRECCELEIIEFKKKECIITDTINTNNKI